MEIPKRRIHCVILSIYMYHCPHCGNFKYVPFPLSQSVLPFLWKTNTWNAPLSMTFKLINVKHRHCVFTIDENLRDFFPKRPLLWIACSIPLPVSFPACFELNNQKNLRLVLSWSYIPDASEMESSYPLPYISRVAVSVMTALAKCPSLQLLFLRSAFPYRSPLMRCTNGWAYPFKCIKSSVILSLIRRLRLC